ncbi:hypothetical protein NOR_01657 [Metarhizium rileyi]|uniref:Uncharacterized protein n=1 Tax=Metarhizium rileyi (strain RCEF 4871) TaxID=1649241 RepID=A0A167HWK1_METRR|nr:hypothetical protein NOR_01657 [Metarhizium rileyi RCEF 4871]TWU72773.1 hypothetical protein ED733_003255 [Metarhizium rileyi]
MRSSLLSILAAVTATAKSLIVEKAIVYSKEPCEGEWQTINPDDKCTLLPANLRGIVNGAKVPEGVVCDFYTDDQCEEPLWIGMEDPGTCSFSELEIGNQAKSVHCYDDTERGEM